MWRLTTSVPDAYRCSPSPGRSARWPTGRMDDRRPVGGRDHRRSGRRRRRRPGAPASCWAAASIATCRSTPENPSEWMTWRTLMTPRRRRSRRRRRRKVETRAQPLEQREVATRDPVPPVLLGRGPGRAPEPVARHTGELHDPVADLEGVRGDDEPVDAVLHDLRDDADVGRDDRQAEGERLEDDEAERLVGAGQREDVRGVEGGRRVGSRPAKCTRSTQPAVRPWSRAPSTRSCVPPATSRRTRSGACATASTRTGSPFRSNS